MGWLGGYGCGFGHGAKGTKYEKMLGSLIVESSDGKVKFNVGSGFTDKLRENPSQFLDKVIKVRYNDVVQNKDEPDFYALYLPRFIRVREDKTEAAWKAFQAASKLAHGKSNC